MSLTTPDPYAVLGIPRDASDQQVQRAYRRLAKRYHPDLHPDAQTSQQMRRINRAWETLSSPGSRARYDAEAALPRSASYEHWSGPARRSASASPPPQTWNTAWASPSMAGSYPRPAAGPYDDDDGGAGWLARTGTVAVAMLLLVALFVGILPAPLFGIVLLAAARSIFARFD
jgi:curved DNA-binding protein CbpA